MVKAGASTITRTVSTSKSPVKRAWPICGAMATGAMPNSPPKSAHGRGVALELIDAPREDRQEHEIERQDREGAAAAHPAPQLLGAHSHDPDAEPNEAVTEAAKRTTRRRRSDHRLSPTATAVRLHGLRAL